MKVLHVIPSVSPTQGGPSRAIVEIERALAARGVEVTTVATNDDGDAGLLSAPCNRAIAGHDGTRWYFSRDTVFYKFSAGLGRWLGANIPAFDVVHAHGLFSFAPVAAGVIARRAGVPYVLRPLGVLAPYGMTQHHPLLKRLSFAMVERGVLEAASAVHFTSHAEKAEAEALGLRCRSVVIPLGIEVESVPRGKPRQVGGSLNLLFLSRIDPKKNLEGLLRALQMAVEEGGDVRLKIAGDGDADYLHTLRTLTTQLGLAERVEWLGYVDGPRKQAALAEADAFVLPSFSENFGIAVVEALASGLPCVISREVAVHEEVAQAEAGIVVGVEPESVAAAIRRLLVDPVARTNMSKAAGRLATEVFSRRAMGERLESLYQEIRVDRSKAIAA